MVKEITNDPVPPHKPLGYPNHRMKNWYVAELHRGFKKRRKFNIQVEQVYHEILAKVKELCANQHELVYEYNSKYDNSISPFAMYEFECRYFAFHLQCTWELRYQIDMVMNDGPQSELVCEVMEPYRAILLQCCRSLRYDYIVDFPGTCERHKDCCVKQLRPLTNQQPE